MAGTACWRLRELLCLTFGTLTLVAAPIPELRINPWVAIAVSLAFGGITVFLVRLAMRARRLKARLGADALVGSAASAMEALAPEGHVLVEGEIWSAVASEPVAAGTKVARGGARAVSVAGRAAGDWQPQPPHNSSIEGDRSTIRAEWGDAQCLNCLFRF